MKISQVLPLVLLSVVITACGPAKMPLSVESRQALKTVAIDSDVDVSDSMYFHGTTQTIANNFGLIGNLIAASSANKSEDEIKQAMEDQNVSVENIVRTAFRNEMAKHTPFKPFAEMQDSQGDVIWRNKGTVNTLTSNNKAKYTYDQMLTKPDVLREMIQTAANIAASNAMADL